MLWDTVRQLANSMVSLSRKRTEAVEVVAWFIRLSHLQLFPHLLHLLEPQREAEMLASELLEVGEALEGPGVEAEDAVAGSQG